MSRVQELAGFKTLTGSQASSSTLDPQASYAFWWYAFATGRSLPTYDAASNAERPVLDGSAPFAAPVKLGSMIGRWAVGTRHCVGADCGFN